MDADDLSTPARLALRRRADGSLDDVVVRDVQMFRAEMLDEGRLWLCCYLPGTAVDRIGSLSRWSPVATGSSLKSSRRQPVWCPPTKLASADPFQSVLMGVASADTALDHQ